MTPIKFPEHNTIAKTQSGYLQMPVYKFFNDAQGRIVCCWQLTWRDRIKLLITGKIWHQILTPDELLQPQLLTVDKPEMTVL